MTPTHEDFINKLKNYEQLLFTETIAEAIVRLEILKAERDEYALMLFQPIGESHHNANKCPYCKENLNDI